MQEVFEKIIEKLEDKRKIAEQLIMENPQDELDRIQTQTAEDFASVYNEAIEIVKQEAEKYNNGWIPFVQREMTEDEKESFGDLNFMLDCQLPDEDEEILITYKFKDELYVYVDTFMHDCSECYLDSGRDFVTEAVAWMKKPQPYQQKGE